MPSPAADWYTVMVIRSSALAKSKSIPATSLPISAVMSEHCRLYGAQNCPAIPYWLYGVATGLPGEAGGLISALTPDVADSGCGTPGLHRSLRPPMMPDSPSEQNPSSPPISPMPGTEHGPPSGLVADCALAADTVRAADSVLVALSVRTAATPAGRADGPASGCLLGCARTKLKSTANRTSAMAVSRGTRRALDIWGAPGGLDAPVRGPAPQQDSAGGPVRSAGHWPEPDGRPDARRACPLPLTRHSPEERPTRPRGPRRPRLRRMSRWRHPLALVRAHRTPGPALISPWSDWCPASGAGHRRSGRPRSARPVRPDPGRCIRRCRGCVALPDVPRTDRPPAATSRSRPRPARWTGRRTPRTGSS